MGQNNMIIQQAELEDIPKLSDFSIETFYDTYQAYNTPEDMQEYVNNYFSFEHLTHEISTNGNWFFLAKAGNDIAGYIKLRDQVKPTSIEHLKPIEVERIYVHPSQKGKGIGRTLLDHGCNFARLHQYKTLWLGVWEKNTIAIRFYEQYGFTNFGKQLFVLGKDVQQDLQYMIAL